MAERGGKKEHAVMKRFKLAVAVAALAIAGMASSASADILTFVSATEGSSWTSVWTIDVSGLADSAFDKMVLTVDNSNSIEKANSPFIGTTTSDFDTASPGVISAFAVSGGGTGGWTLTSPAIAAGTATSATADSATSTEFLTFTVHATDDKTDGIRFTIQTFLGSLLVGEGAAGFRQVSNENASATQFKVVPLPPAAFTGLALMAGLGLVVSRRRKGSKIV